MFNRNIAPCSSYCNPALSRSVSCFVFYHARFYVVNLKCVSGAFYVVHWALSYPLPLLLLWLYQPIIDRLQVKCHSSWIYEVLVNMCEVISVHFSYFGRQQRCSYAVNGSILCHIIVTAHTYRMTRSVRACAAVKLRQMSHYICGPVVPLEWSASTRPPSSHPTNAYRILAVILHVEAAVCQAVTVDIARVWITWSSGRSGVRTARQSLRKTTSSQTLHDKRKLKRCQLMPSSSSLQFYLPSLLLPVSKAFEIYASNLQLLKSLVYQYTYCIQYSFEYTCVPARLAKQVLFLPASVSLCVRVLSCQK